MATPSLSFLLQAHSRQGSLQKWRSVELSDSLAEIKTFPHGPNGRDSSTFFIVSIWKSTRASSNGERSLSQLLGSSGCVETIHSHSHSAGLDELWLVSVLFTVSLRKKNLQRGKGPQ